MGHWWVTIGVVDSIAGKRVSATDSSNAESPQQWKWIQKRKADQITNTIDVAEGYVHNNSNDDEDSDDSVSYGTTARCNEF